MCNMNNLYISHDLQGCSSFSWISAFKGFQGYSSFLHTKKFNSMMEIYVCHYIIIFGTAPLNVTIKAHNYANGSNFAVKYSKH